MTCLWVPTAWAPVFFDWGGWEAQTCWSAAENYFQEAAGQEQSGSMPAYKAERIYVAESEGMNGQTPMPACKADCTYVAAPGGMGGQTGDATGTHCPAACDVQLRSAGGARRDAAFQIQAWWKGCCARRQMSAPLSVLRLQLEQRRVLGEQPLLRNGFSDLISDDDGDEDDDVPEEADPGQAHAAAPQAKQGKASGKVENNDDAILDQAIAEAELEALQRAGKQCAQASSAPCHPCGSLAQAAPVPAPTPPAPTPTQAPPSPHGQGHDDAAALVLQAWWRGWVARRALGHLFEVLQEPHWRTRKYLRTIIGKGIYMQRAPGVHLLCVKAMAELTKEQKGQVKKGDRRKKLDRLRGPDQQPGMPDGGTSSTTQ